MENRLLSFLTAVLFFCISCDEVNQAEKPDKLVDSVDYKVQVTFSSTDKLQQYLDSIIKSSGGNITISSSEVDQLSEKTSQDEKGFEEIIRVLDFKTADSILKTNEQKYVLFHFWATWCAPCRKEFPELLSKFKVNRNVSVFLVSCDINTKEQRQKVLSYYKSLDTDLPIYMIQQNGQVDIKGTDAQKQFLKQFGLRDAVGLPFNLLLNSETRKVLSASGNFQDVLFQLKD